MSGMAARRCGVRCTRLPLKTWSWAGFLDTLQMAGQVAWEWKATSGALRAMPSTPLLLVLALGGCSAFEIPPSLRGTPFGATLARPLAGGDAPVVPTEYLELPLDHFNASDARTRLQRYWVINASWNGDADAPILLNMPGEGAASPPPNAASAVAAALGALEIRTEHRFFGESVPANDSSVPMLRCCHTVEQNLADMAALASAVKRDRALAGPVVAQGGSYSGASTCWMRTRHAGVVAAGVAESASTHAVVDFHAYDAFLARALASPEPACLDAVAAAAAAIDELWLNGTDARDWLKRLFHQESSIGTPQGDVDFLYMSADSVASSVQYGGKAAICDFWRARPWQTFAPPDFARAWANFTLAAYGAAWPSSEWYDSEAMARAGGGSSARAWYWLKCSELAYLQAAPPRDAAGGGAARASTRSRFLTVDALLAQCLYLFPGAPAPPRVDAFNDAFGGLAPENKGATNVLFLAYSDDPWQPAQPNRTMGATLPLVMTDDGVNGSCAHCGAGCTDADVAALDALKVSTLQDWLGL